MTKIGILLKSTNCSKYLYDTVSELAKSNQIEIFFLLNSSTESQQGILGKIKSNIKVNGFIRFIELVIFKLITATEHKILSAFSSNSKIKEHNRMLNIEEFNQNDIIYLTPLFSASGLIVRYPDESIDKIKLLDLDLIIRGNALGIFKGDILKSAKKGIISFHHGDNRWNRGGPSAFWEVYLRKPSTGFIIQILTEQLDGGLVIFRGNMPTLRSYTETIVNLFNESNYYLAKIILQFANNNHFPSPEERTTFGGSLLRVPTCAQSISYLLRTDLLFFTLIIKRLVLRKKERWGVAFVAGSWRDAILRKGVKIINPPNRFFADPFVVTKNNRTVCFVEDYPYKQRRGCITAVEIIDKQRYEILGPVIEESFHMSFPYLLEYQQELYMIPETVESNSIRLYKCIEFPLKWEYQKDILSGVNAADPMIFEHKGKWWLLINEATKGNSDYVSQLMAYYSEQPLSGEWIPHERNPLVFDSTIGRNGGIFDVDSNFPIRCRQKQGFNMHRTSLTLARIIDITPSSYSEEEIGQISPNFFDKIKSCHHIHGNDKYTVFDYARSETLKGKDHRTVD